MDTNTFILKHITIPGSITTIRTTTLQLSSSTVIVTTIANVVGGLQGLPVTPDSWYFCHCGIL